MMSAKARHIRAGLIAVGIVACLVALASAASGARNAYHECEAREVPVGAVPAENAGAGHRGQWWPLGVGCGWRMRDGTVVFTSTDDWLPTVQLYGGLGCIVAAAALSLFVRRSGNGRASTS